MQSRERKEHVHLHLYVREVISIKKPQHSQVVFKTHHLTNTSRWFSWWFPS